MVKRKVFKKINTQFNFWVFLVQEESGNDITIIAHDIAETLGIVGLSHVFILLCL